jgi:predicted nucleic acid-binding protein
LTRFWDASAVVPLLLDEAATAGCRAVYGEDSHLLVWWGTELECVSAVSRCEREGIVPAARARQALSRLDALKKRWDEVLAVDLVREQARRLMRVHPLRTADSLQLAAASVAASGRPAGLPFVCLDARLADAASREGFAVVAP